ncbi:MAG: hypothetical protein V1731_00205 [Candidatus Aenigmatarchaeota archaeon]
MQMEELLAIKPQIESTKSRGDVGTGSREFAWFYTPGRCLKRLKEEREPLHLEGGRSNCVIPKIPVNTKAIAYVHNHPNGMASPDYADINMFLYCIENNSRLDYSLTAATQRGIVTGYYVMRYSGTRPDARKEREIIDKDYEEWREKMRKERIFISVEEQIDIALKLMEKIHISGKVVPLPGYKVDDWKFLRV